MTIDNSSIDPTALLLQSFVTCLLLWKPLQCAVGLAISGCSLGAFVSIVSSFVGTFGPWLEELFPYSWLTSYSTIESLGLTDASWDNQFFVLCVSSTSEKRRIIAPHFAGFVQVLYEEFSLFASHLKVVVERVFTLLFTAYRDPEHGEWVWKTKLLLLPVTVVIGYLFALYALGAATVASLMFLLPLLMVITYHVIYDITLLVIYSSAMVTFGALFAIGSQVKTIVTCIVHMVVIGTSKGIEQLKMSSLTVRTNRDDVDDENKLVW